MVESALASFTVNLSEILTFNFQFHFYKNNAKPKLATKMASIIIANCNLGYYSILFLINPGLKEDLTKGECFALYCEVILKFAL